MKKLLVTILYSFLLSGLFAQQNQPDLFSLPEVYVDVTLKSPAQLQQLAHQFSVDKVVKNNGVFQVRLWLGPHDYQNFLNLGMNYSLAPRDAKWGELSMATTYEQMSSWNKYPTYSVYCAMLDTFRTRFPSLCHVDTILAATPNNHSLFACHLGSNLDGVQQRPQFFYTSTMHGDEQTGFVMMLRLIDYLLNNYTTDAQVQNIMDHVDLWICPVENPDGMYASSDNSMGGGSYWNPGSTRANAHNVDLNRSYPEIGQPTKSYEPEIQGMMDFASQHHFVMSANFHGGAELYNFPWDYWTTNQMPHADLDWWWYMGRAFADTCHKYGSNGYFTEETNGVTPGGDWYVIDGSRQDYMNYYQHCREVTIEISEDKSPSGSQLPQFWTNLKHSLLNYIEECLNGFNGTVTDSVTGEPLEAMVFIHNHDINYSEVYSYLPEGKYYRPIKAGTYTVTYSAEGYVSKTIQVTTTDGTAQQIDVQLVPEGYVPGGGGEEAVELHASRQLLVYPDPVGNVMHIRADGQWQTAEAVVFDATGRQVINFNLTGENTTVEVSRLAKGTYFVQVRNTLTGAVKTLTVVKN